MSRDGEEPLDLPGRLARQGERGVRRVAIEIGGELVTFTRRDARVQAVCTCGGERCEHYTAALRFFGEDGANAALAPREAGKRSSLRPPASQRNEARALADALSELCLATARAGTRAPDSPSLRAALEQLNAAAPEPLPIPLARFVGRFTHALASGEVGELARLLTGAQRFSDELLRADSSAEAKARARAWLGVREGEAPAALTDMVLMEIGREWLAGRVRSAIERRYLVDLATGELYCEERRRGDPDISVGPCPRVVQVAFAELETALSPGRARLLQYTVTPEPSALQWTRLAALGEAEVSVLAARFAEAERRCPGMAEPAALFVPRELVSGPSGSLRDSMGVRLALSDDSEAPLADTLRALSGDGDLLWILGRLRGLESGLTLRPISVLVRRGNGLSLRRVT
jgi:hypothetical protein